MREKPTRLAIHVAFFACLSVWSGCSQPSRGTISLLDQISQEEPAGPWRVVRRINMSDMKAVAVAHKFDPVNLRVEGGVLVQTDSVSSFTIGSNIRGREIALIRLQYSTPWQNSGVAVLHLLGTGTPTIARAPLRRRGIEFLTTASVLGAKHLRLSHVLPPGSEIPLTSITVLAAEPEASRNSLKRAQTLLRWSAAAPSPGAAARILRFKKFPLALDNCTRECVALATGDTLSFQLPGETTGYQLVYRYVSLLGKPRLKIQTKGKGIWRNVVPQQPFEIGVQDWRSNGVVRPLAEGLNSIRFILQSGTSDELLALAEPMLVPLSLESSRKKNLIIVDLDTMRQDRLGCYGYTERPTSVRLDSVLDATGFFVFQNAYSTAPWTLPATARFLTGRYLKTQPGMGIPEHYMTVAEALRDDGYYCIGFTGGGHLRKPGFEQGFHDYFWTGELGKVEDVFPEAIDWLMHDRQNPFFLFLHTYEPHSPFTRDTFCKDLPHGRLGDLSKGDPLLDGRLGKNPRLSRAESVYVQAAYDGGVRKACDATADLCVAMEKLRLWENTVLVVLSDHGEEFWDHSEVFGDHPMASLYGELLNVPFMIYSPDRASCGIKSVDVDVSTIDLLPTVIDLLGVPTSQEFQGISLCPLMRNEIVDRDMPILGITWPHDPAWTPRVCVFSDKKKYMEPVTTDWGRKREMKRDPRYPYEAELYLLDEDPLERHNMADERLESTEKMASLLHEGLAAVLASDFALVSESELQVSNDLKRQLKALGYIEEE